MSKQRQPPPTPLYADPFTRSVEFEIDQASEGLWLALKAAGLLQKLEGRVVLIATPASERSWIIAASRGPCCIGCGEATWLSPSSRKAAEDPKLAVVCTHCLDPRAIFNAIAVSTRERSSTK